jgi:hypothetical protein
VPFGGINESAIDLEIQYRVNEDGNLRLFNGRMILIILDKTIYPKVVPYEVDFDTFKELVNKIFTK